MTFTLDDDTAEMLRRTAARLKKPESVILREAIQGYVRRYDPLSDQERTRVLKVLDRVLARIPVGSRSDANAEKAAIRDARRRGGRRTRVTSFPKTRS